MILNFRHLFVRSIELCKASTLNFGPKMSTHCCSKKESGKKFVKGDPAWLEDWYQPNSVHV